MCTLLEELVIERQCNDHLCWAAVASGISAFYKDKPPLKQCQIAHNQILATQVTAPNCCPKFEGDKCNKDCDHNADLEDVLTLIEHLESPSVAGPPSKNDLKIVMAKIRTNPVCVRIEFEKQ